MTSAFTAYVTELEAQIDAKDGLIAELETERVAQIAEYITTKKLLDELRLAARAYADAERRALRARHVGESVEKLEAGWAHEDALAKLEAALAKEAP